MSKGIVLADGSPASPNQPEPPDGAFKAGMQALAEQCVKAVGGNLLTVFPKRFAAGARIVNQIIVHLADGTFVMTAASLNKHAPGGVDGFTVNLSTLPKGVENSDLDPKSKAKLIDSLLKPVAAKALDAAMAELVSVLPVGTLNGHFVTCDVTVLNPVGTVCTALCSTRLDDDHPELPVERGE